MALDPKPSWMLANVDYTEEFEMIAVQEERERFNIPIGYDKETTMIPLY